MKLYFGRININQEPKDQISQAYYHAPKGTSYFGELNAIEDFVTYVYGICFVYFSLRLKL